ncbi:hypothetical protein V6N11_066309 [Hibiscus sabdariffa]|uniref:Uncharacterized protein n=1 Tax=Hibiscus sabdariffa TaxID=183260 RepID=A0ABR2A9Q0_9ROSI
MEVQGVEGATEGADVGVEDVIEGASVESKGNVDILDATDVDVRDEDGETDNESVVESAYESEDDDVYYIKIRYLSDGEGDNELQYFRDNLRVSKVKMGQR